MGVRVTQNGGTTTRISTPSNRQIGAKTVTVAPLQDQTNTLDALTDVDASDSDNEEVLVYDSANGTYVIKTIPTVDGGDF